MIIYPSAGVNLGICAIGGYVIKSIKKSLIFFGKKAIKIMSIILPKIIPRVTTLNGDRGM